MTHSSACRPTCPCKANTAQEALGRTMRFLGVAHPADARPVLALLRENGWELTRTGGQR